MRITGLMLCVLTIALLGGCRSRSAIKQGEAQAFDFSMSSPLPNVFGPSQAEKRDEANAAVAGFAQAGQPRTQTSHQSDTEAAVPNVERKIIRNAEVRIETGAPDDAQQKIVALAAKYGGFVVTSEGKQNQGNRETEPARIINIVIRVPAAKFDEAISEIRRAGGHVLQEKLSGKDVTEEYLDVEARLRAKRALETQFLEIMKRATKVSEALEVQAQLSEVRTEIERFEGRRRWLANQAELSTINVTLHTPIPVLATTGSGLWFNVKSAFGDGLEQAVSVVLGLIQFVIVMIPVLLLIVAPAWFVLKWLRRRVHWRWRRAGAINAAGQD